MIRPSQAPSRTNGATPFWRQRDWLLWCQTYLRETPRHHRGAWVQTEDPATSPRRNQLAVVEEFYLAGVKLFSRNRLEPGSVVVVELWERNRVLRLRILQAKFDRLRGEWLHTCTFLRNEEQPAFRAG